MELLILKQCINDDFTTNEVLPILKDADESISKIKDILLNKNNTIYKVYLNEKEFIGVVVMAWDTCEIIYIALNKTFRSKGYGKLIIEQIKNEGKKRNLKYIIVGTGNSSLDNIKFYQKCNFRFESIKKDYFSYINPPIKEFGIELKDMIIFKYYINNL